MLSDSFIALHRPTQPRTFVGLMTLYESNFIRLISLLPNFKDMPVEQVSGSANDLPLFLSVRDRGPYTTTLHMTYLFQEEAQSVPDPDLTVRIYHDARMVEYYLALRGPGGAAQVMLRSLDSAKTPSESER